MKRRALFFISIAGICSTCLYDCASAAPVQIEVKDQEELDEQFVFELDGTTYQLPVPLLDLIDAGWVFEEEPESEDTDDDKNEESYEIPGMSYLDSEQDMIRENSRIQVTLWNPNGSAIYWEDAYVCKIIVEEDGCADFKTAKEATIGTELSLIEKNYGKVEETNPESMNYQYYIQPESGVYLHYWNPGQDNSNRIVFTPDKKQEKVKTIELGYWGKKDTFDRTISDNRPSYLNNWKEPAGMGTQLSDFTFKINDMVTSLPVPLDIWLNQGVKLEKETAVPGLNTKGAELDISGTRQIVILANDSDEMVSAKNAYIKYVSETLPDNKETETEEETEKSSAHITLSGNVACGDSADHLFKICSYFKDLDENPITVDSCIYWKKEDNEDNSICYILDQTETRQEIAITVKENMITKIEVLAFSWTVTQ